MRVDCKNEISISHMCFGLLDYCSHYEAKIADGDGWVYVYAVNIFTKTQLQHANMYNINTNQTLNTAKSRDHATCEN